MTITTITTATAADMGAQDAAETQAVTRADYKGGVIRLFDGRRKVSTVPAPALGEQAINGILAGMAFPTTVLGFRDAFEVATLNAFSRLGSVVPDNYRYAYGADQNCGDDLATVLREHCNDGSDEMDLEALKGVAAQNGIAPRLDGWLTKGLNPGMLRMNTGNVLRGMVRRGETVRVGAAVWNKEA